MALAFPGILLYGIARFAVQGFITGERQRKVYHYLNAWLEASLQFRKRRQELSVLWMLKDVFHRM